MCGIAGIVGLGPLSDHESRNVLNSMKHRGPDGSGVLNFDNGTFLHTRLSILDTSDQAAQPMTSVSRKTSLTYNGEIYNYQSIRDKSGLTTKSSGDTETLLEAWDKNGKDILSQLNGMFAFAIYENNSGDLHLIRDRMGIKPLYYYHSNDFTAFASELGTLKTLIVNKAILSINDNAISHYLHLGYIPEPLSIYNEIKKLPKAAIASVINGKLSIKQYWQPTTLSNDVDEMLSYDKAKNCTEELLIDSVKKRMIADRPVGTFLSGGIDSSLVTAIAAKCSEQQKIDTFSIGFHSTKHNEAPYARQIAKQLGTSHHELLCDEVDVLQLVSSLSNIYGEPFADSSAIPTLLVSEMARRNVVVALSGDGGDELFMGYNSYRWARLLGSGLIKSFSPLIRHVLSIAGDKGLRRAKYFDHQGVS